MNKKGRVGRQAGSELFLFLECLLAEKVSIDEL
jgi:hypothetical protein